MRRVAECGCNCCVGFQENLRILERVEQLATKKPIAQLSIEAFAIAIFPRAD